MLSITKSIEDARVLATEPNIILVEIIELNPNITLYQSQTDALLEALYDDLLVHDDTQNITEQMSVPNILYTTKNLEEVGNRFPARTCQLFSRSLTTIYSGNINYQWECLQYVVNQILEQLKRHM
jgi:hypothetical protein